MRRSRTPITLALTLALFSFVTSSAQAVPPTIPYVTVSEATTTSITLEADVNPEGKGVNWHFEYGPADCTSNPCTSVPSKDKVIVAGTEPVRVSEPIEGLTPGTTYHYRVVAKNGAKETAESPDRLFATYSPPQVFKPCPNDSMRKGASALLPDCRAYEQASPVNKNGGDVMSIVPFLGASVNGDAVTFMSDAGIPGGEGSQELPLYLASRGKAGWSTQGLLPAASVGERARVLGWLPDYSQTYSMAIKLGDPRNMTFLARSSSSGALATISPYAEEAAYFYVGATEDGSTVFFETGGERGSNVFEGKSGVYAWDRESGKVVQASVLNDEEAPPKGAFAGSYDWILGTTPNTLAEGGALRQYYTQDQRAISADGSAVYFTASGTGQLYLRRNPTEAQSPLDKDGKCLDADLACTIKVNVSRRTIPDPAGTRPGAFQGASADGTKSFFTSSEMLTNDANTGPEQEQAAIARSDLDGKPESIDLDFIPTHAKGLAVDDEYIYWANPGGGTIGRAKLNGEEVDEAFISTGPGAPQYVAVDDTYLYWTNVAEGEIESDPILLPPPRQGTIGRAKLGPSGAEEVKPELITGASQPQGIAVGGEHIYWANAKGVLGTPNGNSGTTIARADTDGGNVDQIFVSSLNNPTGVAVNATHFYWADYSKNGSASDVKLRDLDNDPASQKRAFPDPFSVADPPFAIKGIALDDEYVYWASEPNGKIARIDLGLPKAEPSDAEVEFIKGLSRPVGIAVSNSHIYWSSNGEASPNPGNDLYRYDAETDELIDISADAGDPNGAEVRGVVGISEDGSYAYFVANGDLDEGGQAMQGNCSGGIVNGSGSCNLYLWHEGDVRFIVKLQPGGSGEATDAANFAATPTGVFPAGEFQKTSRVTSDGLTLLFRSQRRLTAYENEGAPQLYRYYAPDESLICVSCNPTGEAPAKVTTGVTSRRGAPSFGSINPAALRPARPSSVLTHVLSDDGKRVFFESTDALAAGDTNYEFTSVEGKPCPVIGGYLNKFPTCQDVYQWEAQGKGSCERPEGCINLLSTGTEKQASHFAGASASGDDVFIFTRSRLVGQDTDVQRDVYDLRVGGGLLSQHPKSKPICEGEGCLPGTSTPPQGQSAGTAAFSGPANPKPNRRKKARQKRKKQRKSAQRKRAHRRAHAERRAQR